VAAVVSAAVWLVVVMTALALRLAVVRLPGRATA
jgi:hypothetical protein